MVDGEQKQERDLIAEANAAADRLKEEREKLEVAYKQFQELKSREILGGKTFAGEQQKVELTPEEKLNLEAREYFKGTSLEKVFK